jgi:tetratricopeptide (TPR) repeat protein
VRGAGRRPLVRGEVLPDLDGVFLDDQAAALGHATGLRDAAAQRGPGPALADGLACQSGILATLGRYAEAAEVARQALAVARQIGYPLAEALALLNLSVAAYYTGDLHGSVQLARQAEQITTGVPGPIARTCGRHLTYALMEAGDLAGAESVCAAALTRSRDAGDLWNQELLLSMLAVLDLDAGRLQDAAAHLREVL